MLAHRCQEMHLLPLTVTFCYLTTSYQYITMSRESCSELGSQHPVHSEAIFVSSNPSICALELEISNRECAIKNRAKPRKTKPAKNF
jgi:hypothetical protein